MTHINGGHYQYLFDRTVCEMRNLGGLINRILLMPRLINHRLNSNDGLNDTIQIECLVNITPGFTSITYRKKLKLETLLNDRASLIDL